MPDSSVSPSGINPPAHPSTPDNLAIPRHMHKYFFKLDKDGQLSWVSLSLQAKDSNIGIVNKYFKFLCFDLTSSDLEGKGYSHTDLIRSVLESKRKFLLSRGKDFDYRIPYTESIAYKSLFGSYMKDI